MKKSNFNGRMQIRVDHYKITFYREKTICLLDCVGKPPKSASKPIVNIYAKMRTI